jgi:hypothetical protein
MALEKLRQSGERTINGVLFDMRTFDGKLIRTEGNTFTVDSKRKSLPRSLVTINYKQVLELNGKGIRLSYFPPPDLSPFGDWNAVKALTRGDTLDITLSSGGDITAVLFSVSDASLTLMDGDQTKEINQADIRRIFLARREPHSAAKALAGAGKGASAIGRPRSSNPIGAALEGAIMLGAATVGAVSEVSRRSPNDRLLIFAK